MSIRLKLGIVYIACVLFSAFVLVSTVVVGTGKYTQQVVEAIIGDDAIDKAVVEVVDILAEIKYTEDYEPERLITEEYVKDIDQRLQFFNSSLVVVHEDNYYTELDIPNATLEKYLIKLDELKELDDESYKEMYETNDVAPHRGFTSFEYNEYTYTFFDYTFELDDNEVIYYILTDVTSVEQMNVFVKRGLGVSIFVLILLMTMPLILLIQHSLIKPLKKLQHGANQIAKGNLEFELKAKTGDEVGQVIRSYEKMRYELKKSIEQQVKYENNRKELISSISHDLKTPMTSIKGYVEGILDGVANTDEKRERYLKVIHQKSLDMDRMIDDLFTFSKLDLNKLPFEFIIINMELFLRDYLEEVEMEYNDDAAFEFTYLNHGKTDPLVNVDLIQIRRVLQNLIQNSVKYNDSIEKKVGISLINDKNYVDIEVKDNGIGMNAEDVEHAFETFYRSDASRNTDTGGSGLGLAIVKHIVEEHKGKIKVVSSKDNGTVITLRLNKDTIQEEY